MDRGTKVLIVDDEEINLALLKEIVTDELNFSAITAIDGIEAIDKLKQHPDIKLILLDRMMPNVDGMEFMSIVKSNPEFANIPVIMQTAASSPKEVIEGSSIGVYYYLTKPFTKDMVVSVMISALDSAV